MKQLAVVKNPVIVSRFEHLACQTSCVINGTVHPSGEVLERGTVLAKIVSTGKFRAYAEAPVTVAFSNAAAGFTLDPAAALTKHFRVGDVIESVGGTALGTIATFNPATGAGTLTGNSANNLAIGQKVRVATSALALAGAAGRLLQDEVEMDGSDAVGVAFFEGFFLKASTGLTDAAITAMGAVEFESGEVRLK